MIIYRKGNLFESSADAFAHGCNTQGKMGAGIAKDFQSRFPEMYQDYLQRCKVGNLHPGTGYLFQNEQKPHIINLITQSDGPAQIPYVDTAFAWLSKVKEVSSVAIPKIASGLGSLDWNIVQLLLEKNLGTSELDVMVYTL
jgi:O-acetyl-ADP-ribose deacetylase (regulator of RNase III)